MELKMLTTLNFFVTFITPLYILEWVLVEWSDFISNQNSTFIDSSDLVVNDNFYLEAKQILECAYMNYKVYNYNFFDIVISIIYLIMAKRMHYLTNE